MARIMPWVRLKTLCNLTPSNFTCRKGVLEPGTGDFLLKTIIFTFHVKFRRCNKIMRLVGESIHCDEWWGQHHHISTVNWYPVWFATAKKQLHTVDDDIGDSVGDDDSCLKNQRMIPRFYFTPNLTFAHENIGSEFPQRTFKFRLAAWVGKKLSMTPWPNLIRPCGSHQMVFHEAVHRPLHSGSSLRWSVSPGISVYIYISHSDIFSNKTSATSFLIFSSSTQTIQQSIYGSYITIEISQMWVHTPLPWMILLMEEIPNNHLGCKQPCVLMG